MGKGWTIQDLKSAVVGLTKFAESAEPFELFGVYLDVGHNLVFQNGRENCQHMTR